MFLSVFHQQQAEDSRKKHTANLICWFQGAARVWGSALHRAWEAKLAAHTGICYPDSLSPTARADCLQLPYQHLKCKDKSILAEGVKEVLHHQPSRFVCPTSFRDGVIFSINLLPQVIFALHRAVRSKTMSFKPFKWRLADLYIGPTSILNFHQWLWCWNPEYNIHKTYGLLQGGSDCKCIRGQEQNSKSLTRDVDWNQRR